MTGSSRPRRLEEAAHGLHHPAGDDDHVEAGGARGRAAPRTVRGRSRPSSHDERAVEVGRDDGDVAREVGGKRERQPFGLPPVAFTT